MRVVLLLPLVEDCVAGLTESGDGGVDRAKGAREYHDSIAEDVAREAHDLGAPGIIALGRDVLDLEAGDLCVPDQVGRVDLTSRGDNEDGVNLARDRVLLPKVWRRLAGVSVVKASRTPGRLLLRL